ncbi:serine hydroxymethyltransferase, partial [Candidatus Bathyarchaeota archaeon]|nr:serine hydroxymethyltransferase [Candidatus Bathyarchaeota archaeon]
MATAQKPIESYREILSLLEQHHKLFQSSIPLIASENVPSPAVREALATDFGNRYAEGWPGERVYAGCEYIDKVELLCIDLAKRLFKAEFVDVRPISGVIANLVIYTAFVKPNDMMLALSIPCGGHISMAKEQFGGTAGSVRGLRVDYLPYDYENLTVDVDATKKKVAELLKANDPPKLVMFGGSVLPFPHPVKELEETFHSAGAKINFDAAHVCGLIAGGQFQDPLREGADSMTMSTHKTLPGPQHAIIASWNKYEEQIKKATFPGLTSNHHLHAMAGTAIALAEMLEFGKEYSAAIIRNAKALGEALNSNGVPVLGEKRGFTESHLILVDVTKYGDGGTLEQKLERTGIIVNRNLLPRDIREGRHYMHPGGIRLGVSEITRLGMGPREMADIARLLMRVIVKDESPEKVRQDVTEFRRNYQKVHYCFENATEGYQY